MSVRTISTASSDLYVNPDLVIKEWVYLNWANSILSEVGKHVTSTSDIQNGKSLCEIIDVLTTDAYLVETCEASGGKNPKGYLQAALEHMRAHGIKFVFTVQDLLDGDVKCLLDVLWLIILNYSIHDIAQDSHQRSVGIGKKNLLDWCQQEVNAIFDPRNTLTSNLCTGQWFTKLVKKFSGAERTDAEDRVSFLEKLLHEIQDRYAISEDIVSASDIVDGTVDEHTLMIYLSLLKRRVGGKKDTDLKRSSFSLTLPAGGLNLRVTSQTKRSRSASPSVTRNSTREEEERNCSDSELFSKQGDTSRNPENKLPCEKPVKGNICLKMSSKNDKTSTAMSGARSHESVDEGSDWFSSTSGSMISSPMGRISPGKDGRMTPLDAGREQLLKEAISQRVWEHMPQSDAEEGQGNRSPPQRMSNDAHSSNAGGNILSGSATDSSETVTRDQHRDSQFVDNKTSIEHTDGRLLGSKGSENVTHTSSDIKIKRPKDYFRQWEDTIDRLSHGPVSSDSSRSSSRSRSRSHESNRILGEGPHKSSIYLERDSLRSVSYSPSRSSYGRSVPFTYDSTDGFSHRLSSPSPQRRDVDLNRNKEVPNLGRRAESAGSTQSRQREASAQYQSLQDQDLKQESPEDKSDAGHISDSGGDSRQQMLEIQHFLSGADLKDLTLSLKPGQKVDVMILFEALRKAREAVDSNMPKDDFRSRRLQQQDSAETELKTVNSESGVEPSVSGLRLNQCLEKQTIEKGSASETLEECQLSRIHSPGRDIRDVERERSPSAVIGLSRRHPSMSPRRLPVAREPVRENLSFGLDGVARRESLETVSREGREQLEGGCSRVPRREAWERRRQKNLDNIPLDASRMDSLVQAKFVEVLCQEIEELKHKVEVMDQPRQMASSTSSGQALPTRYGRRNDYGDIDRIENPFQLETDIRDENGRMLFETSRSRSASPHYSQKNSKCYRVESNPYQYQERLGRSLHMDSHEALRNGLDQPRSRSLSPNLERQSMEYIQATGSRMRSEDFRNTSLPPERCGPRVISGGSPRRYNPDKRSSRHVSSLSVSSSTPDLSKQQQQQHYPISLGYSSPVRSVSQEIWGNKLTGVESLTPLGQDRWKQLISNRNLTDEDIIELKQALAGSIVENDILQAKLNNAKAEVSEKLSQTNGILDDCRKHLAKSQAENMELRSNLERERQQRQDLEVRVKELEESLYQSKSDVSRMDEELNRTRDELNRTIRDEPRLEEMRKENRLLQGDLSQVENINSSLKQEVGDLHLTQEKAQATIRDLRMCLEEVRQERSQLFEEVMSLQLASSDQKAKVQSIIHRYNDKDVKETVNGHLQNQSFSPSNHKETAGNHRETTGGYRDAAGSHKNTFSNRRDTRRPEVAVSPIRIHSQSTPKSHQRTSTLNDDMKMANGCPKLDGSLNLSGIVSASPVTATCAVREDPNISPGVTSSYREMYSSSPGVPSSYREIYPHRKSRYYNQDPRDSPVHFIDYSDLQQYPTKLNCSEYNLENKPSQKDIADSFRDLSHSNFIRRKLRYSPGPDRDEGQDGQRLAWFLSNDDFAADPSIIDTIVESPVARRCQPVRLSQSLHESSTGRMHCKLDADRLNRSYSSVYDLGRVRSNSPAQQTSRRGILKNGKSLLRGSHLRERSCSPVLQHQQRPHSPPTRLSPRSVSPRSRSPGSRSLGSSSPRSRPHHSLLGRSYSTTCLDKSVWRDVEKENTLYCDPQLSSMKRKAWYELQMQTPAVLNDEQKRYADHLIEKYTGVPLHESSLPMF